MTRHLLLLGLFTSAAMGALATSAIADPPGRVGRVAVLDGDVSFQPPGVDDWSWASRNYPVTDGESFWTGEDGRVELQVGAVDIRADSQTEVDVPTLHYGEMRLALPQGSLDIRLRRAPEGGVVVSTPAGDVRLDQAGVYRVDVGAPTDDGSYPVVEVTTLEGDAGAPSPDGLVSVPAGQGAVIYAGYDPQLQDAQYASIDDWGHELEARERARPRYDQDDPNATLTGYDDLAAAGEFTDDPQYGQVWYPREVPADWAPYRYGHWSYVEPWGYTWVDDQSWGFAPFHYGRWTRINDRWAWVPGRPAARPVYAPALVAFVGGVSWDFGGGGGGAVGWVPLAPDEVYRPSYRVSDAYLRQVNVANIRNTTIVNNLTINTTTVNTVTVNTYRNAGSATVVKAAAFSGAAPVQRAALRVTASALAEAPRFSASERPAPSVQARTGAPVAVAGRSAPPTVAARPPQRIAAVRAAVVAPPAAANRPPVIAGARIAPTAPRPATMVTGPVLVAPAQVRNPAAQRAAAAAAPRMPAAPQPMASRPVPRPYAPPLGRSAPATAASPALAETPDQARAARARAAKAEAAAEAQASRAQAAQAQASQAEAARQTAAREAQMHQAGATSARTGAAEAQAREVQQRDAQARQADVQAVQAQSAQAAARNAAQAQSRAAQQSQAAQEAQMEARAAQARAIQAHAATAPPPRVAPARAEPKPAPSPENAAKRRKETDPNARP